MIKKLIYCFLTIVVMRANAQVLPTLGFINYFGDDPAISSVSSGIDGGSKIYTTGRGYFSSQDIVVQCTDSTGAVIWTYIYDNGGYDSPNKIRTDAFGNSYVTGVSAGAVATGLDMVLIALDPTGTVIFIKRFDNGVNDADHGMDVVADASGDIYVTCKSKNAAGYWNAITLKYQAISGSMLWQNNYTGNGFDDIGICLTLANNQADAIIAGTTNNGSDADIVVYRLDASTGSQGWSTIIQGTTGQNDNVNAIILAGANVVIAGMTDNTGTDKDYTTAKIDASSGGLVFQKDYNFSPADEATSLVRDSTGNIGVTGIVYNSGTSFYEYHTILYDSLGTQYWTHKELTNCTAVNANPVIVCDTIAHHFYVVGEKQNASTDILVYQLTPGGNLGWEKSIDRPLNNSTDIGTSIVVNGLGVLFISGSTVDVLTGDYDMTTLKITQTPVYFPIDTLNGAPNDKYLFYRNIGQIKKTSGLTADSVLAYCDKTSPEWYFKNNSFSFVHSKIDTIISTQDSTHRVEIEYGGSNNLAETYFFEEQSNNILNYYTDAAQNFDQIHGSRRMFTPEIYHLVDLHQYSNNDGLKTYFVVKPTASPLTIRLVINGASSTALNSGNLEIQTSLGKYIFDKPVIYQVGPTLTCTTISGAGWRLNGNIATFTCGAYNPLLPLVILVKNASTMSSSSLSNIQNIDWSTFYGGSNTENFADFANDKNGNLFAVGSTQSSNFPILGANQSTYAGAGDAVIVKFSKKGVRRWATYYGSASSYQDAREIQIDASANKIYLMGRTTGNIIYPTMQPSGAFVDNTFGGNDDVFVTRYDSLGQLNWATLYGASNYETPKDMKLDKNENLFIVGSCNSVSGFPLVNKGGAYNSSVGRGFIIKFNVSLQPDWCTSFGNSDDGGNDIFSVNFDYLENIIISGRSANAGGHAVNLSGAYNDTTYHGNGDLFLAAFDNTSNALMWYTYLGGSGFEDVIKTCQSSISSSSKTENTVGTFGSMYLLATTGSANFPKIRTGTQFYDSLMNGGSRCQIVKIDLQTKDITWSTGFRFSNLSNCIVDDRQNLSVIANYADANYILKNKTGSGLYYNSTLTSGVDCGLSLFSSNDTLIHSTYIGGDNTDNLFAISYWGDYLYIGGSSLSGQNNTTTWPLVNLGGNPPAWWQPLITNVNGGDPDATVTRLNLYNHPETVDINDIEKNFSGFIIYPNPSKEKLYVKLDDAQNNLHFEIYSLMGQLILYQDCKENNSEIDVNNLASGIYIIRIKNGDKSYSGKFIKQ